MGFDLSQLKSTLQNHMGDGMLVVLGSGASLAEGIPGMPQLAKHLIQEVGKLPLGKTDEWVRISSEISAHGLEAALLKHAPSLDCEKIIGEITATYILSAESIVLNEVFTGRQQLRLAKLLPKLSIPQTGLPIITTNYDRLAEVAAEECGLGVDTLFDGRFAARFDPISSANSFCTGIVLRGGTRTPVRQMKPRVTIYKPHGSLDWYEKSGKPVFSPYNFPDAQRLIITPGNNKFKNGYASPFDEHRSRANEAIQYANRFLIIGYGFNDDHLETHLSDAILDGKPTLVLSKVLSPKVRGWIDSCANLIALEEAHQNGIAGTQAYCKKEDAFFPSISIWDVNDLIATVLTP